MPFIEPKKSLKTIRRKEGNGCQSSPCVNNFIFISRIICVISCLTFKQLQHEEFTDYKLPFHHLYR